MDRVIHFFEQLGPGSYKHYILEINELANRVDKHVLYNIFTQERWWKQYIFPGEGPRIIISCNISIKKKTIVKNKNFNSSKKGAVNAQVTRTRQCGTIKKFSVSFQGLSHLFENNKAKSPPNLPKPYAAIVKMFHF